MVTRIDGNQNALRDTTQVQTNKEVQSNQGQISPSTGVEQEVTIERSFPQHKWSDRGTPDTQKLPFYFIVLINGN